MKRVITFGEIMLRLTAPGHERLMQTPELSATFGGGEANVAVSLANYGIPVSFVTRLPVNDLGNACAKELRGLGVNTEDIAWGGERMGIYFLEMGAVNRASKVIYDRTQSALSEITPGMIDWDKLFDDAGWFHWTGITPAVSESAAQVCQEAINAANKKGLTVSTDLNYRKNLWRWGKTAREVMPTLVQGCDIILGNEEDAAMALDIHPDGVDVTSGDVEAEAYLSVSKKIMEQVAIEGGVGRVKEIPVKMRRVFCTTHEIEPEYHIKIQAAWQKHFDNSVSKTINFSHKATTRDVMRAYLMAWKLGCKGITIYRDGSKEDQVLVNGKKQLKVMRMHF